MDCAMFPFLTALNASTLFPFKLDVEQQIHVAAEAGYNGIELWVGDIESYVSKGGTIAQLKAVLAETGIVFVNAIAFFKWADADVSVRQDALIQAEREISMLADLGCLAVAAPPYGDVGAVSVEQMASYFATLAHVSRKLGVEPYLEFWGRASKLSTLHEAIAVKQQSKLNDAKILLDPFHMYTGGSQLSDLDQLLGEDIGIYHVNDYPAIPSREEISDSNRVFPGEGMLPSHEIALQLFKIGYQGYLSLELFIDDYGQATALEIARKGLVSIKAQYSLPTER
jgi:2-keto-myo-inositol isomerase